MLGLFTRPEDPKLIEVWLKRIRERLETVQAQIAKFEKEKQALLTCLWDETLKHHNDIVHHELLLDRCPSYSPSQDRNLCNTLAEDQEYNDLLDIEPNHLIEDEIAFLEECDDFEALTQLSPKALHSHHHLKEQVTIDLTEDHEAKSNVNLEEFAFKDSNEENDESCSVGVIDQSDPDNDDCNSDASESELRPNMSLRETDFKSISMSKLRKWMSHFGLKSSGLGKGRMISKLEDIQLRICGGDPQVSLVKERMTTPASKKRKIDKTELFSWFKEFIHKDEILHNRILLSESIHLNEVHSKMTQERTDIGAVRLLKEFFEVNAVQFVASNGKARSRV